MSSSYPALWNLSKIMPVAKTHDPANFVQSNGNNHAEPDHYAHRKKWNDESTSIRLEIKPHHNHSPSKNNE
jgi:hypothetical protein